MVKREGFYGLFDFFFICFLQPKDTDTCLLSDTQLSNTEPLIFFLIDVSTLRFVS